RRAGAGAELRRRKDRDPGTGAASSVRRGVPGGGEDRRGYHLVRRQACAGFKKIDPVQCASRVACPESRQPPLAVTAVAMPDAIPPPWRDRKSTRLNSSHQIIS